MPSVYREIRRVLRPRGSFLFNAWGDLEHNEFTAVVCDALRERYHDHADTWADLA